MEKAQEITRKQLELFWLQVRLVTVIRDFQKPVDFRSRDVKLEILFTGKFLNLSKKVTVEKVLSKCFL